MTVSAMDISAEEAAVAKVEQKSKASDRRATWAMPARLKLKSGSSLSVTGTENASLFPLQASLIVSCQLSLTGAEAPAPAAILGVENHAEANDPSVLVI